MGRSKRIREAEAADHKVYINVYSCEHGCLYIGRTCNTYRDRLFSHGKTTMDHHKDLIAVRGDYLVSGSKAYCIQAVSYTHLTLPTIYSV